jgi:hypothetical protein
MAVNKQLCTATRKSKTNITICIGCNKTFCIGFCPLMKEIITLDKKIKPIGRMMMFKSMPMKTINGPVTTKIRYKNSIHREPNCNRIMSAADLRSSVALKRDTW